MKRNVMQLIQRTLVPVLSVLHALGLAVATAVAVEYQRSPPRAFAGGTLVVAWPDANDAAEPIKSNALRGESYNLLIHFHGQPDVVLEEAQRVGFRSVIAIVNFPGLSSAYQGPFENDVSLFEQLLAQSACELRQANSIGPTALEARVTLSSFSAGYGAVREIFKSPHYLARIDGYLAADSIYASIVPADADQQETWERKVNAEQMKDFLALARLATQGEKFFLLTHSAQTTPYASTTETSDYLIQALGLSRNGRRSDRSERSWPPESECVQRGFHVSGYSGQRAENHMEHLRRIGDALERVKTIRSKVQTRRDVDPLRARSQSLINHDQLDGWYHWLRPTQYEDPDEVFSVNDGAIRITGKHPGYLATKRSFEDYQLSLEFRWGHGNNAARQGKARDSGLFLHATGEDGNSADADGAYMAAVECQIMEAAVGDLMLIRGRDEGEKIPLAMTARILPAADSDGWPFVQTARYEPDRRAADGTMQTRMLRTWGRLNRRGKRPDWEDHFALADPSQFEKPAGEWNRLVVRCAGNVLVVALNDHLVNAAWDVTPRKGKLLLQSEGSEVFFRRIQITPIR